MTTPTETPTRNVEALETVMQYIMDHPEQHYQPNWIIPTETPHGEECRTAACFAGWTALLYHEQYGWERFPHSLNLFRKEVAETLPSGEVIRRMNHQDSEDLAPAILGITKDEANTLFAGDNTRPMLQLMVKDLVNGEKLKPSGEYGKLAHESCEEWVDVRDAERTMVPVSRGWGTEHA